MLKQYLPFCYHNVSAEKYYLYCWYLLTLFNLICYSTNDTSYLLRPHAYNKLAHLSLITDWTVCTGMCLHCKIFYNVKLINFSCKIWFCDQELTLLLLHCKIALTKCYWVIYGPLYILLSFIFYGWNAFCKLVI